MRNRFQDAIDMQSACNPSGVAHSIIEAIKQVRDEPAYKGTESVRTDPAIKLMVYQLAYLCGVTGGVADFHVGSWEEVYHHCKAQTAK